MKQASLGLGNSPTRTRKRAFLAEMERVVSWADHAVHVPWLHFQAARCKSPIGEAVHELSPWSSQRSPSRNASAHPQLAPSKANAGYIGRIFDHARCDLERLVELLRQLLSDHHE